MLTLDDIDRKLLTLLQEDDRLSLTELSAKIGVPASTLSDRIKRLTRHGFIKGFHAQLDPEALGLNLLAFMLIAWSDPRIEPVFKQRIAACPAVMECHHVTGAWNYLLKIRVRTTREFENFLSEVIKQIEGVQRTETLIVLSSPKETHAYEIPT